MSYKKTEKKPTWLISHSICLFKSLLMSRHLIYTLSWSTSLYLWSFFFTATVVFCDCAWFLFLIMYIWSKYFSCIIWLYWCLHKAFSFSFWVYITRPEVLCSAVLLEKDLRKHNYLSQLKCNKAQLTSCLPSACIFTLHFFSPSELIKVLSYFHERGKEKIHLYHFGTTLVPF